MKFEDLILEHLYFVKDSINKTTPDNYDEGTAKKGCFLMTKTIDLNKRIWEGWTVQDFIEELEPVLDIIQAGKSWHKPMTTRTDLVSWCKNNQPYYKQQIPEVVDYFAEKYNIY